jgi:hypothetical protein
MDASSFEHKVLRFSSVIAPVYESRKHETSGLDHLFMLNVCNTVTFLILYSEYWRRVTMLGLLHSADNVQYKIN